jgi:hypothetical protein
MTLIATIVRDAAKVTMAKLVNDAMDAAQKTVIASVPFAANKELQKILRLQQRGIKNERICKPTPSLPKRPDTT